jgi:hypothetical protein
MKKAEILAAVGTLLDELFAEKSTNLSRNASQVCEMFARCQLQIVFSCSFQFVFKLELNCVQAYTFIDKAAEALNKHEATHNGYARSFVMYCQLDVRY